MLAEDVRVQERQFDGVADGLDLAGEPTDVRVVDVGNLFEDELLDLAFGDALVRVGRTRLEQQGITDPKRLVAQEVGQVDDPLLVGVPDHQRPVAAVENLLQHDDLTGALEPARGDDVHGLVEHDLLAVLQRVDLDLGRHRDAQLAAGGEDVHGAVLEGLQEDAVAARRLGEPVDLLLEGDHLVAGLAQRLGQPVVAVAQRGDPTLRLGEPFLEHAHVPRRFGDLGTEQLDLLLQEGSPAADVRAVGVTVRARAAVRFARLGSHAATSYIAECSRKLTLHISGPVKQGTTLGNRIGKQRHMMKEARMIVNEPLRVWIDQEECTGDGLCVEYAPEVFEFDVDGLAYVKNAEDELLDPAGAQADVPAKLVLDVVNSAKECPGTCIHVLRASDGLRGRRTRSVIRP